VKKLADGRFETTLTVQARKLYADGKGKETEAKMAETSEFGLFAAMPGQGSFAAKDVLLMTRLPLHSGTQIVKLVTAKRPAYAGADPYNVRIDRNSDDNVVATTE
jgi:ABC-2 type transport system permease protein